MRLSLPSEVQKEIEDRVKSGQYRSAEDVIAAAVLTLKQQDAFDDFAPGELDALIEEGERDIANGDVVPGEEVFAKLRRMSAERRGGKR
jgi:Arc/MetJ-type ribon-helix-helix transcriptional regulator